MVLENKQLLHFSEGWRKAKILFIKNTEEVPSDTQETYWYMNTLEDIVKELYGLYGIKNHFTVHKGHPIKVYRRFSNSHFHIDISSLKKAKKELGFKIFDRNNLYIYENLYTNIAREMCYIVNEDILYFGMSEEYFKDEKIKALETLKEIRTDLSSKEKLISSGKKARYDWLKDKTRKEIVELYDNYSDNIDIIISKYITESKSDLINYVKHEFEGNQLNYFLKLLGV